MAYNSTFYTRIDTENTTKGVRGTFVQASHRHLATLGPCCALGDVTEVRILNRIVRWVKPPYGSGREPTEYEADPSRADLIIHQPGLSCSSRSVSTPSAKSKPGVDLSSLLNRADHTLYLTATIRLRYLALDRPDLQFPSKELARQLEIWRHSNEPPDT